MDSKLVRKYRMQLNVCVNYKDIATVDLEINEYYNFIEIK